MVEGAQARRGRWKSANDNPTVLTTTGDHLEPNCGPGQQDLSACLLSLTLLALLCHTVVEWRDDPSALLCHVLARRQTVFHALQACRRSLVFDSWERLRDGMIQGLALASQCDTR